MHSHQRFTTIASTIVLAGLSPDAGRTQPLQAEPTTTQVWQARVLPLPGRLGQTLVFNSNSPEEVLNPGILLSTLPGGGHGLGVAFNGRFSVFSHHIAKDNAPGQRLLYLGLLAHNPSGTDLRLKRLSGASYLSQPDALFRSLPAVMPDADGMIFAGPGDRTTTELLHGRSPLAPTTWHLPAKRTTLLDAFPIPTSVAILPPINGRSTLMHMHTNGPIYLSEVACFTQKDPQGGWQTPTQADFERVLASRTLVFPRDVAGSVVRAEGPQLPNFRYGRVAGVSVGDRLSAQLPLPKPNETLAFPIASVALNRWGTEAIQSAALKARYPDTAHQAHGNYAVLYDLTLPLANPSQRTNDIVFSLTHPLRTEASRRVVFQSPPARATTFRGTLKLAWALTGDRTHQTFTHIVLRQGENPGPFATLTLPAGARGTARLSLIYPADATPPQLLLIENRPESPRD
jgi:hypothetical protein